jgi:hypothetical protein
VSAGVAKDSSAKPTPPKNPPPAPVAVIGMVAETPVTETFSGKDGMAVPTPPVAATPVTFTPIEKST